MPLLELDAINLYHGDLQAVFDVSFTLERGEALARIGAIGAGFSTLLLALVGLVPVRSGQLRLDGQSLVGMPTEAIVGLGIAMVPEGRLLFPSLTVEENLLMGQMTRRAGPWHLETVYALFPILREFRRRPATRLSGGQQQMVAIGRALMSNPRILLCDELSLGLAPKVVEEIYQAFDRIRADGLSIILVEQDVARACTVSERMVCLLKGRITLAGPTAGVAPNTIAAAYFGE